MKEIFVILTCNFLTLFSRPLNIRGELDVSQNIPRKRLDYLNIKDNPKLKKVLVITLFRQARRILQVCCIKH